MKRQRFFLVVVLILSVTICNCQSKINIKTLGTPNPTSHVFNLPVDLLRDTIVKLFSFENQYENKFLLSIFNRTDSEKAGKANSIFYVETFKKQVIAKEYFEKSGIENDLYIHNYKFFWKSKVYFANGKPMEYVTPFVLHFKEISNKQTMLIVEAADPVVINGYEGLSYHGPTQREQRVKPTTIEEYSLILYISYKLGDRNMPPLRLPK